MQLSSIPTFLRTFISNFVNLCHSYQTTQTRHLMHIHYSSLSTNHSEGLLQHLWYNFLLNKHLVAFNLIL